MQRTTRRVRPPECCINACLADELVQTIPIKRQIGKAVVATIEELGVHPSFAKVTDFWTPDHRNQPVSGKTAEITLYHKVPGRTFSRKGLSKLVRQTLDKHLAQHLANYYVEGGVLKARPSYGRIQGAMHEHRYFSSFKIKLNRPDLP